MTHDKKASQEIVSDRSRKVYDYSNCWVKRDSTDIFAGGKAVSEIGFPLDIPMSNEPLVPPYVINYYATLENSLSLPEGIFGELYKKEAIHLMAYIGEMVDVMNLMDTGRNPLIVWANTEVEKFNRPITIPPELESDFEDDPEGRRDYLAIDQTRYLEMKQQSETEPYEIVYQVLHEYRSRGRENPTDPPFSILDDIIDSLGITTRDSGVFAKIASIYHHISNIYHADLSTSDIVDEKLNKTPLLDADSSLLPLGVISIDGFSSKEISDPVKPEIVCGEAFLSHNTGDFHADASVTLWRRIRDRYHIAPEYYTSESELPIPPNWDSGYKVVVPYLNKDGQVIEILFLLFNKIGNINLDAARRFCDSQRRIYGRETIFVSPGLDSHNTIWESKFTDTSDAEYVMALTTKLQTTPTIKCRDIDFGM